MNNRALILFCFAMLWGAVLAPTASAQDAMQLDLAFRESLSKKPPENQMEGYYSRQEQVVATRRHRQRKK